MSDRLTNNKSKANCLAVLLANDQDKRHGTTTGYRYGCRCERCIAAGKAYKASYTARYGRKAKK